MIIVKNTEDLHIQCNAVATTTEPTWSIAFVSSSGAVYNAIDSSVGSTTGTTLLSILTGSASIEKRVMSLSLFNADTTSKTITIYKNTTFNLYKVTLLPGWSATYEHERGWTVYSDTGIPQTVGNTGAAGTNGTNGALTVTEVEIDFSSSPVFEKQVTIVDAGVSATSKIIASQSGKAATGRDADENTCDFLLLNCTPGTGQFTLNVKAIPGPVSGKFKINYQFS